MINKDLLPYLCCPGCKSNFREQNDFLVCEKCGEKYEIRAGIPILVNLKKLPMHLKKQIKYFEKEDEQRPQYRLAEWQKSYIRRLEENFIFKNNDVLLDVGSGSGYAAVEMAKKGLRVIACDLTLRELIKLKKVIQKENLEKNLFLVCCSAEGLPFQDKIADYLISNAVLEHLPDDEKAIVEISRVCRNKSGLMITVPLKFRYISPIWWIPLYFHDKRIGHLRKYDAKILREKFERFGYKIRQNYYPGHFEKSLVAGLAGLGIKRGIWDKWAESRDKKKENKRYGASNIISFMKK